MNFMEFLSGLLNTVLVAAIPVIAAAFAQYFTIKTKNDKLNTYLDIAADAVKTAVKTVSQTVVEALKSDGAFTEEEQRKALETAKSIAIAVMGDAAHEALSQATKDVDAWLAAKIEAGVFDNKQ